MLVAAAAATAADDISINYLSMLFGVIIKNEMQVCWFEVLFLLLLLLLLEGWDAKVKCLRFKFQADLHKHYEHGTAIHSRYTLIILLHGRVCHIKLHHYLIFARTVARAEAPHTNATSFRLNWKYAIRVDI